MIWRAMRLDRRLKVPALLAVVVPGLLALTAITSLADSSPSPAGSPAALPGDPARGATLYAGNCTSCHGVSLEGGIGAVLNPIDKLPGVPSSLDPTFLITIITNGRQPVPGDPKQIPMPVKGGNPNLTDQDIKDLASFIIQQNLTGSPPLTSGELAKRTIFWASMAIIAMGLITFLLAQYNMRWIARRAAARHK
jgi:mono/diheme cytochrome c family protein